ncbi:hypothetical protein PUN28_006513 [Cardiocondyla obscurior]|uniref:Uncharacterized protein n=1 Tax=Cardiocondyla obscurior TaxID=286306 RepID=A0AAW2GBW0_9HYME
MRVLNYIYYKNSSQYVYDIIGFCERFYKGESLCPREEERVAISCLKLGEHAWIPVNHVSPDISLNINFYLTDNVKKKRLAVAERLIFKQFLCTIFNNAAMKYIKCYVRVIDSVIIKLVECISYECLFLSRFIIFMISINVHIILL